MGGRRTAGIALALAAAVVAATGVTPLAVRGGAATEAGFTPSRQAR